MHFSTACHLDFLSRVRVRDVLGELYVNSEQIDDRCDYFLLLLFEMDAGRDVFQLTDPFRFR